MAIWSLVLIPRVVQSILVGSLFGVDMPVVLLINNKGY